MTEKWQGPSRPREKLLGKAAPNRAVRRAEKPDEDPIDSVRKTANAATAEIVEKKEPLSAKILANSFLDIENPAKMDRIDSNRYARMLLVETDRIRRGAESSGPVSIEQCKALAASLERVKNSLKIVEHSAPKWSAAAFYSAGVPFAIGLANGAIKKAFKKAKSKEK